MMKHGIISAYGTAKYTRLALDKYIRSTRAVDKFLGKISEKRWMVLFLGADGDPKPNSPIKIKKYVRCPGVRKLLSASKKFPKLFIKPTREWGSSQTCARGMHRSFHDQPRAARFKVCRQCTANPIVMLPTKVVTTMNKAELSNKRQMQRERIEQSGIAEDVMPKVKCFYYKPWLLHLARTVTWHRDVVAAKNILLIGK